MEPVMTQYVSDRQFFIILGAVILIFQGSFQIWSRVYNQKIITAIDGAIKMFDPHIERTKKTHDMVVEIRRQHAAMDVDGRPLIFTDTSVKGTQLEILKLVRISTETQKQTSEILYRLERKLDEHKDSCKDQFTTLDKSLSAGGSA